MIAAAPPPPPPVPALPAVGFGRGAVGIGPRTTRLAVVVDGRRGRWRRVTPGPRRVSVRLPSGTHVVRIAVRGPGGARRSAARRVTALPSSGRRAGRVPGFVDQRLQHDAERLVARLPAIGGVYVQHLVTGCGAAVNAGAAFPAASTMKAAVLVEAARRGHATVPGALLDRMILPSDDRAANEVLARLGGGSEERGAAAVTATLRRLGLRSSLMRRGYLLDARRPLPITPDSAPELRTNVISTPYELAQLMVAVHRGVLGRGGVRRVGIGPAAARREIADRLLRVTDRSKLVAGVPPDVPVLHKSGFTSQVGHDAGIIYVRSGPVVAVGMAWSGTKVTPSATSSFLSGLARSAHTRLSGGGRCGGLPLRAAPGG